MKLRRPRNRAAQEEELRAELWPDLNPEEIWDRKVANGYATIPRTIPLVMRIIDSLGNGKPGSTTYLELWCRANDLGVVRLHGFADEIAFASGFSGNRKTNTWESRLNQLEKHGFIRLAPGSGRKNGYALIKNPYFVVQELQMQQKVPREEWLAIFERANTLKANDFKKAKDHLSESPAKPKAVKKAAKKGTITKKTPKK